MTACRILAHFIALTFTQISHANKMMPVLYTYQWLILTFRVLAWHKSILVIFNFFTFVCGRQKKCVCTKIRHNISWLNVASELQKIKLLWKESNIVRLSRFHRIWKAERYWFRTKKKIILEHILVDFRVDGSLLSHTLYSKLVSTIIRVFIDRF